MEFVAGGALYRHPQKGRSRYEKMAKTMQQESVKFINLLNNRAHPQKTNIGYFDQKQWFQGAYRTIQRNVPKGTFTTKMKNQCSNYIFAALPKLASGNFDTSMRDLVENLSSNFRITIGQAQKLVNIILKYHACLFYSGCDPTWAKSNLWVNKIHLLQHVPIDSIVMFGLCRNAPADCEGFVTASTRFAFSKATGRFGWSYNALVYIPDSQTGAGTSFPWSGLADYSVYFRFQEIIRNLAAKKKISPLLYEMRFLWAPA